MLDDLGLTPDAVADSLLALGIKGVRNTVRILNPLVRYVAAQLPDAQVVDLIHVNRVAASYLLRVRRPRFPCPLRCWNSS